MVYGCLWKKKMFLQAEPPVFIIFIQLIVYIPIYSLFKGLVKFASSLRLEHTLIKIVDSYCSAIYTCWMICFLPHCRTSAYLEWRPPRLSIPYSLTLLQCAGHQSLSKKNNGLSGSLTHRLILIHYLCGHDHMT